MARPWRFAPHDPVIVAQLARDLRCSPLLATVVSARGHRTRDEALAYLQADLQHLHDPTTLPGVMAAAERVVRALRAGRRITIYGDYDVDGMTATSLLQQCFSLAGGRVDYYIPSRLEEGYGLNCEALSTLHAEDPQRLVVTVDCGVTSHDEVRLARELGLELIVTDHHSLADELPTFDAAVHPRLPGQEWPFADLCGAGVAFKLAWAVCQLLGDGRKAEPRMRDFLLSALGLAAIGTVADVVPLVEENRVLVTHGLRVLPESLSPGLKALFRVAGLQDARRLTAEDVAFSLGPRLNAAGRLGQARLAVELLTTQDPRRATQLAEYIDQLNQNRQTVERRIFRQAREQVAAHPEWEEAAAFVLADADWHPGVIGIVASRIAERYARPAVLVAVSDETGIGQGSGRSHAGFPLHAALARCAAHLESFGGHQAAAGLRVRREQLDAFRQSFVADVAAHHCPQPRELELGIDAEVVLPQLSHGAVRELERLGPFGCCNDRPRFAAQAVDLVEPPQTFGNGERHLSVRVRQGGKVMRAVAFGKADWVPEIAAAGGPISLCFAPMINRFGGYERVELHLIDWQPTDRRSQGVPPQ